MFQILSGRGVNILMAESFSKEEFTPEVKRRKAVGEVVEFTVCDNCNQKFMMPTGVCMQCGFSQKIGSSIAGLLSIDRPVERVEKGWGYELIIANSSLYCGKILHIDEGKKFSWHHHDKKDEVFYVLSGTGSLIFGVEDEIDKAHMRLLEPQYCVHIRPGLRHQVKAYTTMEIMEVSTEHFDEDSIRIIKGD